MIPLCGTLAACRLFGATNIWQMVVVLMPATSGTLFVTSFRSAFTEMPTDDHVSDRLL